MREVRGAARAAAPGPGSCGADAPLRRSYADAVALRATQATPIQQQVRSDVTRYRYGDEQHLDEALNRIFRINKARGAACRQRAAAAGCGADAPPRAGWRHPA